LRIGKGGFFRARLSFPREYPLLPPKMKFETPIWHPNSTFSLLLNLSTLIPLDVNPYLWEYGIVFTNGSVCISILHPPEEDSTGYESASERWSPVQTPATILLSVISMLSSPNDESAANVEAARQWRDDPAGFKKKVRKCVRDSLEV
jgi:ubiquitin-conjugating enzyme E2 G1